LEKDLVEIKAPILRPLVWLGNSRKNIQAFPVDVQKDMGDEIQLIQFGGMPKDAKPFKGVGSGVFEIALRSNTNAYRAVMAVQLGEKIYVLHAFQKKSPKGVKTAQPDIDLIKQRYKEAQELAAHDQKQKH
jgi:phage-related protein